MEQNPVMVLVGLLFPPLLVADVAIGALAGRGVDP
jgi:hypothetical protein